MDNNVLFNIGYGLYVLTANEGEKDNGCIINTVMQVTSAPLQIAIAVNKKNYTNEMIQRTKKFNVSILSENSNPLSIGTFGFRSGKDFNKFDSIPYNIVNELPIIKDACGYLICEIKGKFETSTHTVYIADVIDGDILNQSTPMTYSYYHNVIKGKSPKNAPTYVAD